MVIDITKIPVYWINSDSATDRAEKMKSIFSKLGFENTTRISATMHQNKVVGCAMSHHNALLTIKDPLYILMEDDIEVTEDFNKLIDIPDDFDAFYLGTSYWPNELGRAKMSLMSNSTQKTEVSKGISMLRKSTWLR